MQNLLVAVPQLEIHRPPISIAAVASSIKKAGFNIDCLDLNIDFFHYVGKEMYYEFEQVWEQSREETKQEKEIIEKFLFNEVLPKLININRLMISVFGRNSTVFTQYLTSFVKKHKPEIEIVLGGQGCFTTKIADDDKRDFSEYMLEMGNCDHVIYGEGEKAIIEFLNGNISYPGIDNSVNHTQVIDLNAIPFPDYSYFDLDKYQYLDGKKEIFIIGSRGCVRKCTYCDVARYWPKYRWRNGDNIADELIMNYEKFGINHFYFTDSLVNGSLKAFRGMCEKLAEYNNTHKAGFNWRGQFIFRPEKQISPEHFDMIKEAGGDSFYVGIETGSDKVRYEMDKKFTNDDIDYHLEQFERTKLKCFFLMITGYLTETIKDHNDTLAMFKRWQKYVATGTITGIDVSPALLFLPGSPLERMIESHQVEFIRHVKDALGNQTPHPQMWESKLNPDLTIKERIRRRVEVNEEAIKYMWPMWRGPQRMKSVLNLTKMYLKKDTVVIDHNQFERT